MGNKFDIRKLNARFIQQGLIPPLPYQSIDTLKVAKRYFAFSAYSLNFLCKMFGLSPKIHTGYELWKNCCKGDEKAIKKNETVQYRRHTFFGRIISKVKTLDQKSPKRWNIYKFRKTCMP